jgi:hypothetical protein
MMLKNIKRSIYLNQFNNIQWITWKKKLYYPDNKAIEFTEEGKNIFILFFILVHSIAPISFKFLLMIRYCPVFL